MVAKKKMPADPIPPGGQKSTFLDKKHVAYQIEGNRQCSNMVANILPAAPLPLPPPQKVKIHFFRNAVILHIKGNCKCSNTVSNAD